MKKRYKILLSCLLALVLIVGSYVAYVFIAYYRIEDNLVLTVEGQGEGEKKAVPLDEELTMTSWNMGFGAYTDQYSFFMDGGKYSRGFSKEIVEETVTSIADFLAERSSDFYLVQEVDTNSTRSYHIDEKQMLLDTLSGMDSTYGLNYDSPYLFWPLIKPHGKSVSGLLTLSDYEITQSVRRSLPVQEDFAKLIDLDRCYTVNRLDTENGKELVIYNLHLSAYTTDPTIANQQLEILLADMEAEYQAGNYVIAGGDFNKDLLGDSSAIFGISGEDYSWAKPFPEEMLPGSISLIAPYDEENPVPSCRNADAPWDPETNFQLTIDGFLVSDNIEVTSSQVIDTQFAWSDHNPVELSFTLVQ